MKYPETAKRLREALADKNVQQQDLADKTGVQKSSISQYVNGSHKPSNISAAKIGKVLNVNPLWLMGFDVEKETIETRISEGSKIGEVFLRDFPLSPIAQDYFDSKKREMVDVNDDKIIEILRIYKSLSAKSKDKLFDYCLDLEKLDNIHIE